MIMRGVARSHLRLVASVSYQVAAHAFPLPRLLSDRLLAASSAIRFVHQAASVEWTLKISSTNFNVGTTRESSPVQITPVSGFRSSTVSEIVN